MPNEIQKADDPDLEPPDLLAEIDLSNETRDKLLAETVGSTVLSLIPGVDKLVSFAESYKSKLDAARLALLLHFLEQKIGNLEQFQDRLKRLLTTSTGLIIFQKVVRISGAGVYDEEHIKILANVLKKVSESDFEELFEEHNYALSQIEKLSPQALLLLSEYSSWPTISFSSSTMSGTTAGSGWDVDFANQYSKDKGITDANVKLRIGHVLHELEGNSITVLEAKRISLSPIGEMVHKYLI